MRHPNNFKLSACNHFSFINTGAIKIHKMVINKKVLKIWLWTGKRKNSPLNFVKNKGKKMIVAKLKTMYRTLDIVKFSLLFFSKNRGKNNPIKNRLPNTPKAQTPILFVFLSNFSFELEIQFKISIWVFFAYKIPTWSAPGITIVFLAFLPRISPYSLSVLGLSIPILLNNSNVLFVSPFSHYPFITNKFGKSLLGISSV